MLDDLWIPVINDMLDDEWKFIVNRLKEPEKDGGSYSFCFFILANALSRPIILYNDDRAWDVESTGEWKVVGRMHYQGCEKVRTCLLHNTETPGQL